MSPLSLSGSFQYLCYGSTVIRNSCIFPVRGASLCVRIWHRRQILTCNDGPHPHTFIPPPLTCVITRDIVTIMFQCWSSVCDAGSALKSWSLDLFMCVPFIPYWEHTVLQPYRRTELMVQIAISVLPGTSAHVSQVKHLRIKCLAQGHNIEIWCPKIRTRETWDFSENPAPSGVWNHKTVSDIDKAPRSDHIAPFSSHLPKKQGRGP